MLYRNILTEYFLSYPVIEEDIVLFKNTIRGYFGNIIRSITQSISGP